MRSRTSILTAGIAIIALSLAACGSSDGDGGSDSDSSTQQSGSSAPKSKSELSWEDSPLAKMYGTGDPYANMSDEEMQAESDEYNRKIEEGVAKCMTEQGFEYTPRSGGGGMMVARNSDEEEDPVEYAQKNGYGFNTQDESTDQAPDPGDIPEDPNSARYETMSESERTAYDEALWGKPSDYDPEAETEYEYKWEENGCYGKAQHEQGMDAYPEQSVYEDPQWKDLTDQMNKLYESMQTSPKMTEINSKWSNCMADAGFTDFKNPNETWEYFADKQQEQWDEKTGEEIPGVRAKHKEEEIKMAVADATCQRDLNYQEEQMKIQFALEQEFIDANKTELESFMAALQAARPEKK